MDEDIEFEPVETPVPNPIVDLLATPEFAAVKLWVTLLQDDLDRDATAYDHYGAILTGMSGLRKLV